MSIAVISCYYNPCGYRLVREKYWRFRECLGRCDYFCVEASWNGQWETDATLRITARDDQIMWQKERLLNALIERLPPKYDRVVWVDSDIIFLNPDWLTNVDCLLDEYPVGQPWSRSTSSIRAGKLAAACTAPATSGTTQRSRSTPRPDCSGPHGARFWPTA